MADGFGQFDNAFSGGSDIWDNGLAGQLLLQDYFAPTTIIGRVKMWTGTAWAVVRVWTGSQWVAAKAWTGTAWV